MARPSIGPKFILLVKTLFALEKQKEVVQSNFWPVGLDHFSLDPNLFCLKLGKNSFNLHIFSLFFRPWAPPSLSATKRWALPPLRKPSNWCPPLKSRLPSLPFMRSRFVTVSIFLNKKQNPYFHSLMFRIFKLETTAEIPRVNNRWNNEQMLQQGTYESYHILKSVIPNILIPN